MENKERLVTDQRRQGDGAINGLGAWKGKKDLSVNTELQIKTVESLLMNSGYQRQVSSFDKRTVVMLEDAGNGRGVYGNPMY